MNHKVTRAWVSRFDAAFKHMLKTQHTFGHRSSCSLLLRLTRPQNTVLIVSFETHSIEVG